SDDTGVYFKTKVIKLEKFDGNTNPIIGIYIDPNSNAQNFWGDGSATEGAGSLSTPDWYLSQPKCSDIFINYKIQYLPDGVDDGDIQDVPITMNALHGLLEKRDRRRDKKKGREVTPVKTILKRGGRDLRKRREANRPITNAF
ncbi:MAG: hypothetical protein KAR20_19890, partial [Candidatus Heimdallarchaeota archaeon]|nr:hypothetical protein [Candidatus Heimdallarchaeota archaeon]